MLGDRMLATECEEAVLVFNNFFVSRGLELLFALPLLLSGDDLARDSDKP